MSSVDQRVVQMTFDNKQFEAGVKQTQTSLSNLNKSLQFKNSGESLKGLQSTISSFNFAPISSAIDGVNLKFDAWSIAAITAIQRITNAVIDLGQKLATELVFKPVTDGFSEYEQGINSVQTIMNNVPNTMDEVQSALDELNTYADKTIYKFSDMTGAIAKFTVNSVDLDTSVDAIQGIANAAALAGANTHQASSAYYNFAQALSAGYMGLLDWRSISLTAGMATEEFKQNLIDTAIAMGTLTEQEGKYVPVTDKVTKANGNAFDAVKGFNESLSSQWMTAEVLTTTLAKYSDETTELGQRAYKAATEVKTLSQLIDTAGEALGTGWAQSFNYIIGNYEEATELWTGISNVLDSMIGSFHDARNAQLETWKSMGGRTKLLEGLSKAWEGLSFVVKTFSGLVHNAIPFSLLDVLNSLTDTIYNLGTRLGDTSKFVTTMRSLLNDSKMRVNIKYFQDAFIAIKQRFEQLKSVAKNAGFTFDTFEGFVEKIVSTVPDLKWSFHWIHGIFDGLEWVVTRVGEAFSGLSKFIGDIAAHFRGLGEDVDDTSGFFWNFGELVRNVINTVTGIIDGFTSALFTDGNVRYFKDAIIAIIERFQQLGEVAKNAGFSFENFQGFLERLGFTTIDLRWSLHWIHGVFDALEWVVTKAGQALQFVGDRIVDVVNYFRDLRSGTRTSSANFWLFGEAVSNVVHGITSFIDNFSFASIPKTIEGAFSSIPETISNAFSNTESIPEMVKNTFMSLPSIISGAIAGIGQFISNAYNNVKNAITNSNGTLFSDIAAGIGAAVVSIKDGIFQLAYDISGGFASIFDKSDSADGISDTLANKVNSIKEKFMGSTKGMFSGISTEMNLETFNVKDAVRGLGEVLASFFDGMSEAWTSFKGLLGNIGESLGGLFDTGFFRDLSIAQVLDVIGAYYNMQAFKGLNDFIQELKGGLSGLVQPVKDVGESFSQTPVGKMIIFAAAIAILAGSMWLLSTIPEADFGRALEGIIALGVIIAGLLVVATQVGKALPTFKAATTKSKGIKGAFDKMAGNFAGIAQGAKFAMQMAGIAFLVLAMAAAIYKIAKAVAVIAQVPADRLWPAIGAIGVLALVVGAMTIMAAAASKIASGGGKLGGVIIAILVMTGVIKTLADEAIEIGKHPLNVIAKGIIAIGLLSVFLDVSIAAIALAGRLGNINLSVVATILVFGLVLKSLASLMMEIGAFASGDFDSYLYGMIGIGVLAAIMVTAIYALNMIPQINPLVIGVILAFAVAMTAMSGMMLILAIAVKISQGIPITDFLAFIGVFALAMGVLVGIGAIVGAVPAIAVGLIALSAALALIGVAAMGLAVAATLMLGFIVALSQLNGETIDAAAENLGKLIEAFGQLGPSILNALLDLSNFIVMGITIIIGTLIAALLAGIPGIVAGLLETLLVILEVLDSYIDPITRKAVDIIWDFIAAIILELGNKIGEIFTFFDEHGEEMKQAFHDFLFKAGEAVGEFIADLPTMLGEIIDGIVSGLTGEEVHGAGKALFDAIGEGFGTAIVNIGQWFTDIPGHVQETFQGAFDTLSDVADSIGEKVGPAIEAVGGFFSDAAAAAEDTFGPQIEAAQATLATFAAEAGDALEGAFEATKEGGIAGLWDYITGGGEQAANDVAASADAMQVAYEGAAASAELTAEELAEKMSRITEEFNTFQDTASGYGDVITQMVTDLETTMSGSMEQVSTTINSSFTEAMGQIPEIVTEQGNSAITEVTALKLALNAAFQTSLQEVGITANTELTNVFVATYSNMDREFTNTLNKVNSFLDDVASGISGKYYTIYNAASSLASAVKDAFSAKYYAMVESGKNLINGIAEGIGNNAYLINNAMSSLATQSVNKFNQSLQINSPSKIFEHQAEFIPAGIALGIRNATGDATKAIGSSADLMVNTFNAKMSLLSESDFDATPTITPVFDLTNAKLAGNSIDSMLNTKPMLNGTFQSSNRDVVQKLDQFMGLVEDVSEKLQNGNTLIIDGAVVNGRPEIQDTFVTLMDQLLDLREM